MKTFILQLLNFTKSQKILHWLVLLLFCSISVFINYGLGLNEKMNTLNGGSEYFSYVALYAIHTIFAYLLYSCLYKDFTFWLKPGFNILLILSFLIFAYRAVAYKHNQLIAYFSKESQQGINQFVFNDIFRLLYLVIPIIIIWFIIDRNKQPLYGLTWNNHKSKLYWMMLFGMLPLIVGACFLSDFLSYYPRFKNILLEETPTWKIWAYEVCYGLDFSSIELFFRGFMVMAFTRYVGINAILPMSSFYLSIHYGKPMGEAISSFFGGTILGIISYQSGSIFGGIMVHAGIAWLMEIGGFIGNYLKKI